MLNEALKYLSLGFSVIPLRPHTKDSPLFAWKEFQSRLPLAEELREWWKKEPTANPAIITGMVSGIAVVDADGPIGLQSLKAFGLTSSLSSITGNNGRHLIYKHPGEKICNSVKKIPGLDVRGDGGYIVAPPSIHPNGRRYMWKTYAPQSMSIFPTGLLSVSETTAPVPNKAKPENWIADSLKGMKHGNIDITLFEICSRLRRDGYSEEDAIILLQPHAERAGATPDHLPGKVRHVWKQYQAEPRHRGLQPQANWGISGQPTSGHLRIYRPSNDIAEYETVKRQQGEKAEYETGYRPLDSLLKGLRRQEVFTVAARTGVGKTNWLIGAAIEICRRGKSILYFSTEMSFDTIWDRYRAALGNSNEFEAHKFYVCDEFTPELSLIEAALKEAMPDVFIFDHINNIGDDHDALSNFMRGLKLLARKFNCPAIVSAQLNRGADFIDAKSGERVVPRLSHIKGSGAIEEVSAAVLLLSETRVEEAGTTIVGNLDKNRFGDKGLVNFMLLKQPYRMVSE